MATRTDGDIVIGTRFDNSKFEEELEKLRAKQEKKSVQIEIKTRKINELEKDIADLNTELEKTIEYLDEMTPAIQEFARLDFKQKSGEEFTPKEAVDYMAYSMGKYDKIEQESLEKIYNIERALEKLNIRLSEQRQTLKNLNEQYKGIQDKIVDTEKAMTLAPLKEANNKIQSVIKSVAKWGFALFGIRSAYNFIRQTINEVAQQNEELAKKMEYIKTIFTTIFEPIAKILIDIIFKIAVAIGTLIELITGKKIFDKVNKNLKSANKNAKELNKTLAGWDEATTLGGGSLASGILGAKSTINEAKTFAQKVKDWFFYKPTKEDIINMLKLIVSPWKKAFDWIYTNYKTFIKKMIDETEPYWRPVWEQLKKAFIPAIEGMKQIWNQFISYLKPIKEKLDEIFKPFKDEWNKMVEEFLKPIWAKFYNSLPEPVQKALTTIWNSFKTIYNDIAFYLNNLGIKIPYIVDETTTEVNKATDKTSKKIKEVSNNVDTLANKQINIKTNNTSVNKLKEILDDIVDNLTYLSGGVKITYSTSTPLNPKKQAKGAMIYPKLAMGGIVSMPGKGTLYGNAIIGERGAEAVIPLTDSQQMALLGEIIGKYITVNATIPVYAYNRQVDRQIRVIKANEDFASNK